MADGSLFRVVGWGPFRLPGERRRWNKAEESARRDLTLAEEAVARQPPPEDRTRLTEHDVLAEEDPSSGLQFEEPAGGPSEHEFDAAQAERARRARPSSGPREVPLLTASVDDAGNRWLIYSFVVPGVDPEKDVNVTVEDGLLEVSTPSRPFSIQLPFGVDESYIETSYSSDRGVLEVRIPISAIALPRSASKLSGREREIAELAARGMTSPAIAKRLSISEQAVDRHLRRVYEKLNIKDNSDLAAALARSEQ